MTEVKKNQCFISAKNEDLKLEHDQLSKINKEQEKELEILQNQSVKLKKKNVKDYEKIDAIEQNGRRLNLAIVGVPFTVGKNTNKIAIEVASFKC